MVEELREDLASRTFLESQRVEKANFMDAEPGANATLCFTICQASAVDAVGYLVFDLFPTV